MISSILDIGLIFLLLVIPLVLLRMVKGPTVMDRVLCFDALSICIIAIMVLLFMKWESPYYTDIILIFSISGFLGTVVFSYYLHKTYRPHPSPEKKGMGPGSTGREKA